MAKKKFGSPEGNTNGSPSQTGDGTPAGDKPKGVKKGLATFIADAKKGRKAAMDGVTPVGAEGGEHPAQPDEDEEKVNPKPKTELEKAIQTCLASFQTDKLFDGFSQDQISSAVKTPEEAKKLHDVINVCLEIGTIDENDAFSLTRLGLRNLTVKKIRDLLDNETKITERRDALKKEQAYSSQTEKQFDRFIKEGLDKETILQVAPVETVANVLYAALVDAILIGTIDPSNQLALSTSDLSKLDKEKLTQFLALKNRIKQEYERLLTEAKSQREKEEQKKIDEAKKAQEAADELARQQQQQQQQQQNTPTPNFFKRMGDWFKGVDVKLRATQIKENELSKFRGEVQPEDETDFESTKLDVGLSLGSGLLSVITSRYGIKAPKDIIYYLAQKLHFTPKERERLTSALSEKESDLEKNPVTDALLQKKNMLEKAIAQSKYLTRDKKAELTSKLQSIIDTYEATLATAKQERDQMIAQELSLAIQTRVKGVDTISETLNSILMIAGLPFLRPVAMGVFAMYRRGEKVYKEVKSFNKEFAKKWIIDAFHETWHQLKGGDSQTLAGKWGNRIKGTIPLLRAGVMAPLLFAQGHEGDGLTRSFKESWKLFNEKGVLTQSDGSAIVGGDDDDDAIESTTEDDDSTQESAPRKEIVATSDDDSAFGDDGSSIDDAITIIGDDDDDGSAVEEERGENETLKIPEEVMALATTKIGDGITEILARQLESNPELYGFRGDVSDKDAIETWANSTSVHIAKLDGWIRPGGETRLTKHAVETFACVPKVDSEGHLTTTYLDAKTGVEYAPEELIHPKKLVHKGFTYVHGNAPGEIPNPLETAKQTMQSSLHDWNPETAVLSVTDEKASLSLLNGKLEILLTENSPSGIAFGELSLEDKTAIEGMINHDIVKRAVQDEIEKDARFASHLSHRILAQEKVIERLDEKGLSNTPLSLFIRNQLTQDLVAARLAPGSIFDANQIQEAELATWQHGEPSMELPKGLRIAGLGQIKIETNTDGEPYIDFDALIAKSNENFKTEAGELLVRGWKNKLMHFYYDDALLSTQEKIGGSVLIMNDAITQLHTEGLGDSPQSLFLKEELKKFLLENSAVLDPENPIVRDAASQTGLLYHEAMSKQPVSVGDYYTPDEEPLKTFLGDSGKVKFVYNTTGEVTNAYIPAYTPRGEMVRDALSTWGLTEEEIESHYTQKHHGVWELETAREKVGTDYATSPDRGSNVDAKTLSETLIDRIQRLYRQEATLTEMELKGLMSTPEYRYWKMETEAFRQFVSQEVTREFKH